MGNTKNQEQAKESKAPKKEVSDAFTKTIKQYLDDFASENPSFAEKYKNEKKSITKCCGFICDEVRKMNVKGLTDDEVFYLARHYYEEENVEGTEYKPSQVVVNHQVVLTEEEKKAAHDKALKDYENAEREKLETAAKKKVEKEKKAIERAKQKEEAQKAKRLEENKNIQVSLFDFLGE